MLISQKSTSRNKKVSRIIKLVIKGKCNRNIIVIKKKNARKNKIVIDKK